MGGARAVGSGTRWSRSRAFGLRRARCGGQASACRSRLRDVSAPEVPRLATGIGELDRVLGGGIVPGSVVLLGGAPGIGKSTLTNMVLGNLAGAGRRTLYVSGEESTAQVALRAQRLAGRGTGGAGGRGDRPRDVCSRRSSASGPRSA